ncbi:hypothetical protein [Pseudonocardia sp. TRM90224]|uniref:hypothetical protein n=1 Tax=Pseudonocardia sp. TRM90224 TaxID=2812678 RepID=UPI001E3A12C4|nr:hypothetical protein [Pseudonocardia sp. TRM90224]
MSIDRILAAQAGVISRAQAVAAGMSRNDVDDHVRLRHWWPLHPRTYLAGRHAYTDEVAVRAAVLWAGAGAVLSGAAAAWWRGLVERPPATVTVTIPRRRASRRRDGVLLVRRDLAQLDVTSLRGIDVTARPLTLLDTAVELGEPGAAWLESRLRAAGTGFDDLLAAHRRTAGGPGAAGARSVLLVAAERAAASAERLLARMLHDAGVAGWHRVPAGIAFPAARVLVEVAAVPSPPPRPGWRVLTCRWQDVLAQPDAVRRRIDCEVISTTS